MASITFGWEWMSSYGECTQVPDVLVHVFLRKIGELGIHVFNSSRESKLLLQKLNVLVILVHPSTKLKVDRTVEEEIQLRVNVVRTLEDWVKRFPSLFRCEGQFSQSNFLKILPVCHKEIEWKVLVDGISPSNSV